ncbi:hypothetical protein BX600DRAFT_440644 [Xylariales sp. PMI_506]|nr:hypothetical protein BX600DRAFT_440644 [Xylariales sp. PMI_506]
MAFEDDYRVLWLGRFGSRVSHPQTRRGHKKSRAGCTTCKSKKVKCDESKPTCIRCQRNGRVCIYNRGNSTDKHPLIRIYPKLEKLSTCNSIARSVLLAPDAKNGTSSVQLMHHFVAHSNEILYLPGVDLVLELSKSKTLVRTIVLAITACHLRHTAPSTIQHRVAEHYQTQLASQQYQKMLQSPQEELDQSTVDGLFISGMLLHMIAFTLFQSDGVGHSKDDKNDIGGEYTSWTCCQSTKERQRKIGWLSLQAGILTVIQSFPLYLEGGLKFVKNTLFCDNTEFINFTTAMTQQQAMPKGWALVFEIDYAEINSETDCLVNTNANKANVYCAPVMALAYLRRLPPVDSAVFQTFQLPSKLRSNFRTLLYDLDARALWIVAYWLGLMNRFRGMWWWTERILREYDGIFTVLKEIDLEGPAEVRLTWNRMMNELSMAQVY